METHQCIPARVVAERKVELWLVENKSALESSNAYVEQHGLPLGRYRDFWSSPDHHSPSKRHR